MARGAGRRRGVAAAEAELRGEAAGPAAGFVVRQHIVIGAHSAATYHGALNDRPQVVGRLTCLSRPSCTDIELQTPAAAWAVV